MATTRCGRSSRGRVARAQRSRNTRAGTVSSGRTGQLAVPTRWSARTVRPVAEVLADRVRHGTRIGPDHRVPRPGLAAVVFGVSAPGRRVGTTGSRGSGASANQVRAFSATGTLRALTPRRGHPHHIARHGRAAPARPDRSEGTGRRLWPGAALVRGSSPGTGSRARSGCRCGWLPGAGTGRRRTRQAGVVSRPDGHRTRTPSSPGHGSRGRTTPRSARRPRAVTSSHREKT